MELTEKCIDLDSKKHIPSSVRLEYSKTQISIQENLQEPQSPMLSIYEHGIEAEYEKAVTKKGEQRGFRHIDLNENLYGIDSPEQSDKFRGGFHLGHASRADRNRENESFSLQSKLNKSKIC